VTGFALICIIVGLGFLLYLCYGGTLPKAANAATGHVIELKVHGVTLYMTSLQMWASKGAIIIGILAALISKVVERQLHHH
jgi:hypothetical protein